MTGEPDPVEVARVMRALLNAIEAGEITADTRKEQGAVRQLRGALAVLEALTGPAESQSPPV